MAALIGAACCNFVHCLVDPIVTPCRRAHDGVLDACDTCGKFVQITFKILCSAFTPYLALTLFFNCPPTVWSIQSMLSPCASGWWLWVNGVMCFFHMIAAFYIVIKIQLKVLQKRENDKLESDVEAGVADGTGYDRMEAKTESHTKKKLSDKDDETTIYTTGASTNYACRYLSYILCRDSGVAMYIVLSVIWIAWQALGLFMLVVVGTDFGDDTCGETKYIFFSLGCGWLYSVTVSVTFGSAFICLN